MYNVVELSTKLDRTCKRSATFVQVQGHPGESIESTRFELDWNSLVLWGLSRNFTEQLLVFSVNFWFYIRRRCAFRGDELLASRKYL